MSQLSILSSDAEVKRAIEAFLATKPIGHYMRWELEIQRRRFAKCEADMKEAKAAQSKYELERNAWICAVGHAEAMLQSAKLFDELMNSENFSDLLEAPQSAEAKRRTALCDAGRQYIEECENAQDDCASFYRGQPGRSSAMRAYTAKARKAFDKAIAAAEEAYLEARY